MGFGIALAWKVLLSEHEHDKGLRFYFTLIVFSLRAWEQCVRKLFPTPLLFSTRRISDLDGIQISCLFNVWRQRYSVEPQGYTILLRVKMVSFSCCLWRIAPFIKCHCCQSISFSPSLKCVTFCRKKLKYSLCRECQKNLNIRFKRQSIWIKSASEEVPCILLIYTHNNLGDEERPMWNCPASSKQNYLSMLKPHLVFE